MKFNSNWLKEYVDIRIPPKKLAEILSLHSFETIFNKKENALEIDISPNRLSDAANYIGMASEIAAISKSKFKNQISKTQIKIQKSKIKTKEYLSINIKEPNLCFRYVGKVILGVKVGPPPKWLKERIEFHGMKSINNLVDAANYVMLEVGQPLHIFDLDKVENMETKNQKPKIKNINKNSKIRKKIIIRKAKNGEKITTLDGEEKILDSETLVIADSKEPLAIAGIKGGKKAEITNETKNIVLESANFDAENIYLTSRRINLKTEASLRFEHNLDPYTAGFAIERLANLIIKSAGGKASCDSIDVFPTPPQPAILNFSLEKLQEFAGFDIPLKEIINILKRLNFQMVVRPAPVKKMVDFRVLIPSYRRDIVIIEDLYEEILRIYGYGNMLSINPRTLLGGFKINENILFENKVKNILTAIGFNEVYNYSFIEDAEIKFLSGGKIRENLCSNSCKFAISLENPIVEDKKYLRPTLIFGLLKNVKDNFRYFNEVRIFELGKVFYQEKNNIKEEKKISGLAAALRPIDSQSLFFEIKGVIETLLEKNGLDSDDYTFQEKLVDFRHTLSLFENNCHAVLISSNGKPLGYFGEVKKSILEHYDIKGWAAAFELDFQNLLDEIKEEREYAPLPVYPSVIRDISMIVDSVYRVDDVLKVVYAAGAELVDDVDLFDIYEGKNIGDGKKSLAFHIVFQAEDRTLTDEEVEREFNKIKKALKEKLGAEIR